MNQRARDISTTLLQLSCNESKFPARKQVAKGAAFFLPKPMYKRLCMSEQKFELLKPFGPPIGRFPIELSIVDAVNQLIDEPSSAAQTHNLEDWGSKLAGEVDTELRIPNSLCEQLGITEWFKRCTAAYIFRSTGKQITHFEIIDCWIVRQYAHDYNPTHWHSGHISGAGWLKIPKNMTAKQRKDATLNGCISFTHGNHQFLSDSVYAIKPEEGLLTIFPHYLMHHVYPFSVEGERRTIAFNAEIDRDIYDVYG